MRIFSYVLMLSISMVFFSGCKPIPKNHLIQNDEERQAAIAEGAPKEKVTPQKLTITEKIRAAGYFPKEAVIKERDTTIPGFYEVTVDNHLYYMDVTEEYLIKGDIIKLSTQVNLTTPVRSSLNKKILEKLRSEDAIHFKAENGKYDLIVFTNMDCEECSFIFKETSAYNGKGISVSYYPWSTREDISRLDNVWCAQDRKVALGRFYSGKTVNVKPCNDPAIKNSKKIAHDLGVDGSIAVFTKDGYRVEVLNGDDMLALLEK